MTIMQLSEKTKRYSYVSIISVLLAVFFILPDLCFADKGGWHLSTEPVTLTESGQRAIIGWDGQYEVLCLGPTSRPRRKRPSLNFFRFLLSRMLHWVTGRLLKLSKKYLLSAS